MKSNSCKPGSAELEKMKDYLLQLGFILNSYGECISMPFLKAGLAPAEAASHIALSSLARDVQEANDNRLLLNKLELHATEILEVLLNFRMKNLIQESVWRSDANAIERVGSVDEYQQEWVAYVLGNRALDDSRMATNVHPFVISLLDNARVSNDRDFS